MSTWKLALRHAPLLLRGACEWNLGSRFGPLPPREWLFPVTYRCDARCVMCNIWQEEPGDELTLEEWSRLLPDRFFQGIESVSLTGGEPTLRRDLPELTALLISYLPSLRRVTVTTNALSTDRVIRQCQAIWELCAAQGIGFFVGISLDGIGAAHDRMRNIPGAFARVEQTLDSLLAHTSSGLRLGVNCTLTGQNLQDAENVKAWCEERALPVNWIVASFAEGYYGNVGAETELGFTESQRVGLAAFLRQQAREGGPGNPAAYFYSDVAEMLTSGRARHTPCIFQKDGFMLDARGDLQYCMYGRILGNLRRQDAASAYFAPQSLAHRDELIAHTCGTCTITCFLEIALAKDALRYIRFLLGGRT